MREVLIVNPLTVNSREMDKLRRAIPTGPWTKRGGVMVLWGTAPMGVIRVYPIYCLLAVTEAKKIKREGETIIGVVSPAKSSLPLFNFFLVSRSKG